ncbi:MAG: SDR family NAD(P)-dependent oxidoreductase [Gemmatimonadales bacterium]|nr:MAG: SDR family NAD(P)-dependent oxidoreductase [Gemmatimonadales bacterium]
MTSHSSSPSPSPTSSEGGVTAPHLAPAGHPPGLAGRVVLVTGGTGGLGRGVVRTFLEAGARVHVPVFSDDELGPFREALGDAADAVHIHRDADLTDPETAQRIVSEVTEAGEGPLRVLVHLAGGFAMGPVEETEPDTWIRMMAMNATTTFHMARAAFTAMRDGGGGRILTVSALPALDRGAAGMSAYGASKAAVLNLTRTLAREGVEHGITANSVLPSIIDTPGNREAMPDADTDHWLAPADIGRVLAFLASDDAAIVNGAALPLTLGEG